MTTCSTMSFSICWCFFRFSSNSSFLVLISSLRLCTSFLSISTNCSSCSLFFLSNSSCCFLHFSFSCEYYKIERKKDSSSNYKYHYFRAFKYDSKSNYLFLFRYDSIDCIARGIVFKELCVFLFTPDS